jgi:hypothetical protein
MSEGEEKTQFKDPTFVHQKARAFNYRLVLHHFLTWNVDRLFGGNVFHANLFQFHSGRKVWPVNLIPTIVVKLSERVLKLSFSARTVFEFANEERES